MLNWWKERLKFQRELHKEQLDTRRALRNLNKLEWSVEFLESMMHRAAKRYGSQLEMEIVSPNGAKIIMRTTDKKEPQYKEETIFDHLDDDRRIQRFMQELERKR